MSRWIEKFENHAFQTTWKSIKEVKPDIVVDDETIVTSVEEVARLVDGYQYTAKHGEVCPAGWTEGKSGMDASPEGVAKFLAENE